MRPGGARERAEQGGRRPRARGRRKERKKRKEKKKMGKRKEREKKKKEGRGKWRERKGGNRADAMRPRPATRDGRVRRVQAGFAAWSTAGRPRARRAQRRMGQRVFGTEK